MGTILNQPRCSLCGQPRATKPTAVPVSRSTQATVSRSHTLTFRSRASPSVAPSIYGPSIHKNVFPVKISHSRIRAGASGGGSGPTTATEAVEAGLKILSEEKNASEALEVFQKALTMKPNEMEAQAAVYNSACCYAKLGRWEEAAEAVVDAVNNYNLKLVTAIRDDDLRELRDRREWVAAISKVKGGITKDQRVDLKAEAKAPFRLARTLLLGGLGAGAALGLFIITTRLIQALQGGPDAPELDDTLKNFGINLAAVVALGFLVVRDLQGAEKDKKVINREEALGELQVQIGKNRFLPLVRLRGTVRPVVVAGSQTHVQKSLKAAKPYYGALRERGISIIPVVTTTSDPADRIKQVKAKLQADDSSRGFGAAPAPSVSPKNVEKSELDSDKKWQLNPYNTPEWLDWINEQKEISGMQEDNCYIQIQLNGQVRSSGGGMPPWQMFISDIPTLDSLQTKLTDNIGTGV